MKRKIILPLIVATTLALALAGCAKTTNKIEESESSTTANEQTINYPLSLEVYDNEGNKYTETFNEAPSHVITNNQSSLELLLKLGLQDSIIGTIALDNEIPEELEEEFSNINIITESKTEPAKEVIVGMSPDLVVGRAATFIDDRYGTIESLNSMNINVYTQLASLMNGEQSLDNIFEDIKNVGKIFNVEDKAQEIVNNMQSKIDEALKAAKGQDKQNVLMLEFLGDEITNYGENSLGGDMITSLGANLVAKDQSKLGKEDIVSLNPDVIYVVYMPYSGDDPEQVKQDALNKLLEDKAFSSLDAVKNKRIVPIMLGDMYASGVRTINGIETISQGLYPDLNK